MRMSQSSLEKLKSFEGCKLEAYKDPVGIWTIGYGHTSGVYRGLKISQDEANMYLDAYIDAEENALMKIPGLAGLSQNRWDAIVDFVYNIGMASFKKSTLLKKIQKNVEDPTIYKEFLRWVKGGGKTLPGLVKRRQWEAKMWEGEA